MKNNIFIKSTLILVLSGFLTKLLGFIIKIAYTRIIGEYGISLYTLAVPTYSLLHTIATLSIPISISKLISGSNDRSIKVLSTSAIIILCINIILIVIMLISSDFIASTLLHNPSVKSILIAFALTLPFVSISSVLKGYFAGKQNMVPHATSNIIEQIIRLIIIVIVLPKLMSISVYTAVIGLVLLTIISEICSIIVFIFFLPKKIKIDKSIIPSISVSKKILDISIPTTMGKIIGNIGFFLEPIILSNLLTFSGYNNSYILSEYSAYNAYAISLLTMPTFFIAALSSSLLPEVSKYYNTGNIKMVKTRIKQSLLFALILGICFSLIIYIFRDLLLFTMYNTTKGSDYIKVLAPFFVLFYLEGILTSSLQALDHTKDAMKITLTGVIIKLIVMSILSLVHIGIYSLVISEVVNIIYVVTYSIKVLKKVLKCID